MGDPIPPSEPEIISTEGQTTPPASMAETTKATEATKPGLVERLKAARERIKAAQEGLRALEEESVRTLDGINSDADTVLKPAGKILDQVNLDKTYSTKPYKLTLKVPDNKPPFWVEGRAVSHYEFSDGVFVRGDGKSIEIMKQTTHHAYEAADPNETGAAEAVSDYTKHDRNRDSFYIQDPEDPTLRVLPNTSSHEFWIYRLDASGKITGRSAYIWVSKPLGENRTIVEVSEGAENIGDPFDIARRTLDFAKSATLKPAAVQPTASSQTIPVT